nr:immunoglobulin light chain junction region [Macaca mulatta]MOW51748.1 immunoglobulin light chain junction region [Macaca mulatta]MOW52954.1 immunoglobulin light chain junction region [Macaca mulatta]MOW53222.1 immunoglobulin light chain junction region [Macaca mulatta]MOW54094.1 immunoglobulin light chain junction region [Macaca mulatta]
CLQYSSSPYSF